MYLDSRLNVFLVIEKSLLHNVKEFVSIVKITGGKTTNTTDIGQLYFLTSEINTNLLFVIDKYFLIPSNLYNTFTLSPIYHKNCIILHAMHKEISVKRKESEKLTILITSIVKDLDYLTIQFIPPIQKLCMMI